MQDFTLIKPEALTDNVFKLLDKDWMLITAGTMDHYNTMTASWGHMGIMWNLPVAIGWVRPPNVTPSSLLKSTASSPCASLLMNTAKHCSSAAHARVVIMIRQPKLDLPL